MADITVKAALLLKNPSFICGHCYFLVNLSGAWTVEDGRLVFRAEADPQPHRGPSVGSCCESYEVAEFTSITTDGGHVISGEEFKSIKEAASHATCD